MWFTAVAFAGQQVDWVALEAELIPRVEAAAGREFAEPVEVRVVGPVDLRDAVGREIVGLTTIMAGELPPEAYRQLRYGSDRWAGHLVGKYLLFEHQVLVSKVGLKEALASVRREVPQAEAQALATCVLAHELTHALQAQHRVMDTAVATGDRETFVAVNSLMEGHALRVSEQVCRELGHDELLPALRSQLGADTDSLTPYALGDKYLAAHPERAWEEMLRVPHDTADVIWPDREPVPAGPAPWDAIDAAARHLFDDPPIHARIGALDLLELSDDERMREVIRALAAGFAGEAYDGSSTGSFNVLQFDDASSARAYYEALHTLRAEQKGSGRIAVSFQPLAPVPGFPDDAAYHYRGTINFLVGGNVPPLWVEGWVVLDGARVATIELQQLRRDEDEVLPALRALIAPTP
ncbi:MAG: hypothetical protein ABMA64_16990 [Myxococcota bacterium]